jgi:LysM repeat protein
MTPKLPDAAATLVQPLTAARIISNNRAPGVTEDCTKYYKVQTGDFCSKVVEMMGISFARLRALNQAIDSNCSNLWLGYDYCVQGL